MQCVYLPGPAPAVTVANKSFVTNLLTLKKTYEKIKRFKNNELQQRTYTVVKGQCHEIFHLGFSHKTTTPGALINHLK